MRLKAVRLAAATMMLGAALSSVPLLAAAAADPAHSGCEAKASKAGDNLERYKRDLACRIHARNGTHLYEGPPPPVLRSVVVLSVRIDARGRPVRIGVLRSNGIRSLERRAIQSVRAAAPLPIPAGALLRRGAADITETWLFRDDGRFQVRTLAQVQAPSGY
jgi:periplasmic protein TonB